MIKTKRKPAVGNLRLGSLFFPMACICLSLGCVGPQKGAVTQSSTTWIEEDFLKREIVAWVVMEFAIDQEGSIAPKNMPNYEIEYFAFRAWQDVRTNRNTLSNNNGGRRIRWAYPVDAQRFLLGSPLGPDFHQLQRLDNDFVRASLEELFDGGTFQVIDFLDTACIAVLGHFEEGGFFFLDWQGPMTVGDVFTKYPPAEYVRTKRARVYRNGRRIELNHDLGQMLQFHLKPRDILVLPSQSGLIHSFGVPKNLESPGE